MAKRRLLWQLYPSYVFVIIVIIITVTFYASRVVRHFYLSKASESLESQANLIKTQIELMHVDLTVDEVDRMCKTMGREVETRITVILPSGLVIGDSEKDPTTMDNHRDRPEIKEAASGNTGTSSRYSYTLEQTMLYLAIPVYAADGSLAAVVRMSVPVSDIDAVLNRAYLRMFGVGILIAFLAGLISLVSSHRISKPIKELERGAERFAKGDLGEPVPAFNTEELNALSDAMNRMAAELEDRLESLARQRSKEDAILSSMGEGVLAVDNEERIIMLNEAASRMLLVKREGARGRDIHEVVRNSELHRLISRIRDEGEPSGIEITLSDEQRIIDAQGSVLTVPGEVGTGVLIIVRDVTQLRKLERVRKDFIANVSHELRTPITSIQGFVETLLQGAIKKPDEAKRFLNIIAKQTERLNAIIGDLLALSKIEKETERAEVSLERESVRPVLEAAIDSCRPAASSKEIRLNLECSEPCEARLNEILLEQAVINLLDNAIKHSEPGSEVGIQCIMDGDEVHINVRDSGPGIAEEHHARLFERFYRVDQARSRKMGGTGLGLSIVKHIALAHGGSVSVESTPGKGSTFSITLPNA